MAEFFVKELSGNSGCRVCLYCGGDGDFFVRKVSSSVAYNRRLIKQYIKQKKFIVSGISTPNVLGKGFVDGLFYFDMDFLDCTTLAEHIKDVRVRDVVGFIDTLFDVLPVSASVQDAQANKIFQAKVAELEKALPQKTVEIDQAIEMLKAFDYSGVLKSYCCGDLTLENILVGKGSGLYLIDFLDSFYNSWMIDVAKLLQDLDLKWSYRKQVLDFNSDMRLWIGREALTSKILELENGRSLLLSIYYILLLNVLRIAPYAKEQDVIEFIDRSIPSVVNTIRKIEKGL